MNPAENPLESFQPMTTVSPNTATATSDCVSPTASPVGSFARTLRGQLSDTSPARRLSPMARVSDRKACARAAIAWESSDSPPDVSGFTTPAA